MRMDVEYNNTPQRPLTIWEQYQIAERLAQYPALTLKVLMRRKVGLRRSEPMHFLFLGGVLFGIGYITRHSETSKGGLMVFAVVMVAAGYWQQINRWKEFREEIPPKWHTYSDGISPIEEYGVNKAHQLMNYLITRINLKLEKMKQERKEKVGYSPEAEAQPVSAASAEITEEPPALPPNAYLLIRIQAVLKTLRNRAEDEDEKPQAMPAEEPQATLAPAPAPTPAQTLPLPPARATTQQKKRSAAVPAERLSPRRLSLEWWQCEQRIYRRLDPFAAYLIGFVLWYQVDALLGLWIMFAAGCLNVDQNLKWRHNVNAVFDMHDAQIDNEVMRDWGGGPRTGRVKPRPLIATHGLPTGIGDDIRGRVEAQGRKIRAERIREHQAERDGAFATTPKSPAPDNLIRRIFPTTHE